jgi:hypothetical protein
MVASTHAFHIHTVWRTFLFGSFGLHQANRRHASYETSRKSARTLAKHPETRKGPAIHLDEKGADNCLHAPRTTDTIVSPTLDANPFRRLAPPIYQPGP